MATTQIDVCYAPTAKCSISLYWSSVPETPRGTAKFDTWSSKFLAYKSKANTSNNPDRDYLTILDGTYYTWVVTSVQAGYDFIGWYTLPNDVSWAGWESGTSLPNKAEILVESGDKITSDQISAQCKSLLLGGTIRSFLIVPKFVPQQGVLAFDANGGSVIPTYKTVAVGSAYGTLPTPTRPGYTFAGWFTAASGGSAVSASTTMGTSATAVIHAHWSTVGQPRTIYFDAAGGTCPTASKSATVGSAVGSLPTATRSGYTFVGWFRSTVGEDQVTAQTIMGEEDLTLYAHWSATTVTITFNANGGTVDEPSRTVPYGRQIQRLPLPVRPGQAFDGWFTAATGGTEITKTTIATTSLEVYAHWRPNSASLWSVTTF